MHPGAFGGVRLGAGSSKKARSGAVVLGMLLAFVAAGEAAPLSPEIIGLFDKQVQRMASSCAAE
jgi:hypothetical protein